MSETHCFNALSIDNGFVNITIQLNSLFCQPDITKIINIALGTIVYQWQRWLREEKSCF